MMNFLAICLVLTSLAGAGVWSPSPVTSNDQNKEDVIVKEGRRVIVVKYDQQEGGHQNTIVSISPEQQSPHVTPKPQAVLDAEVKLSDVSNTVFDNAKDKIKEAASVFPNLGQGLTQQGEQSHVTRPRELICDAFGKCKHKIANAIGKTKDKVSEIAREELDKKKKAAHEAMDVIGDVYGKAKEEVSHRAQDAETITKEGVEKSKDTIKTAKDKGKTAGIDIASNMSEMVMDKAEEVREGGGKIKDKGKREMNQMLQYARPKTEILNSLMGLVDLLGFSIAYGTCVWVTFISSYVLSRAIPRQQFGVVQSKIYPVYFRAMSKSIGMALLGHILSRRNRLFTNKAEMFQVYNLLASLLTVFINSFYLEPRATKVMFERMKMEKEEGRGKVDIAAEPSQDATEEPAVSTAAADSAAATTVAPSGARAEQERIRSRILKLNDKLKKMNSYSSLLNILTLMSLTWHLVYLGQRLHLSC